MNSRKSFCICGIVCAATLWAQSPEKPQESASGLDIGAIDKSADPCQNFYQYACGGWMKNNTIPPDESQWGRFDELVQRNQLVLRGILEEAARNQTSSPINQKIGGFY
ncbi:MAG: M13 family peptidase, partial [Acidobacteriaceae bacterium]|nr:M13 family peptidase [Acidobacteriaceae bacterium]